MSLVSFRLSLARVLMVTTVVLGTHASAQTTRVPASGAIPALNAVAGALQKAGVRRCADKIQKVTDFLTKGARVGTTVFPMAANPDDSLISISSEIVSGQVLTYASANFAPRADGCSAEYEQVSHWQNTCEQVRASQFANFKPMGQLQQAIKVYYNQAISQVMLVPAGAGCVVIKKEIVH
jgi:hypothetical protein